MVEVLFDAESVKGRRGKNNNNNYKRTGGIESPNDLFQDSKKNNNNNKGLQARTEIFLIQIRRLTWLRATTCEGLLFFDARQLGPRGALRGETQTGRRDEGRDGAGEACVALGGEKRKTGRHRSRRMDGHGRLRHLTCWRGFYTGIRVIMPLCF